MSQSSHEKRLVGALELCDLPKLAITDLNIRVDTGATTSSLHVDNIDEFEKDGELWVSFDIHPDIHNVSKIVRREAKVVAQKKVKSSTATRERRYTIDTPIVMAGETWEIQLTLTDRSEMTYLMLLGREAMSGHFIVDPEHDYILTKPKT
ncbi:ATP-dependent zinc protease family protein [Alteromonas sp. ASW11-130]|uniref:ATP-dependent zinc protease family protein n=1 Tax=Alteromonas sp. ASW11-130 TaxID=3015775 RepID=UPI002241F884|nr:RimK/LysX family protein [Alteromonas sp. ASW11-130]MCW8092612.1 RimK/LysX family protein [Alteromonas sp. ASW11-130]